MRGTDSWLDDTDNNFGPDLPLLFKLHEIWSVDSQENHQNCCHQIVKCIKFDFGWCSALDFAGGAYSAPTDTLAG